MIRVLICGEYGEGWQKAAEKHLTRDRDEYEQGLGEGAWPPESPRLPRVYPFFARSEDETVSILNRKNPQVIISVRSKPGPLALMSRSDHLRWFHFDRNPDPLQLKKTIFEVYLAHALFPHPGEKGQPLVSVFTPTHNSGRFLKEAYRSLTEQTYRNWEWVIVDDGSTDDTPETVRSWASADSRLNFFQPRDASFGNIGRMKHYASGLCRGEYLVELDHDDILTDNALTEVVEAFEADRELGFIYSNFTEFVEEGGDHFYPNWVDRGRYRRTLYRDRYYLEALAYDIYGDVDGLGPVIKDMTICPNHIRAFRRSELSKVGGYNTRLVMGDDFDLIIRFFLFSKALHIDKMLYLYRIHANTWSKYNEFARFFLPLVVRKWDPEIDRRISELKEEGRWLKEVQGMKGQGCGPIFRPGDIRS